MAAVDKTASLLPAYKFLSSTLTSNAMASGGWDLEVTGFGCGHEGGALMGSVTL